mmetsp:Transcript_57042/g.138958  ORF Transcript_57042/g.138958 Transcript_57042/m.138958 type:complete len:104 (+) Transcript_57042:1037-1348(+)
MGACCISLQISKLLNLRINTEYFGIVFEVSDILSFVLSFFGHSRLQTDAVRHEPRNEIKTSPDTAGPNRKSKKPLTFAVAKSVQSASCATWVYKVLIRGHSSA